MTLEQAKRLKEMEFPQYCKQYIYDPVNEKSEHYADPTAEEALEWVKGKLGNGIMIIPQTDGYDISYRCIFDKKNNDTLSDAVYALIVWAYKNKLLEGK